MADLHTPISLLIVAVILLLAPACRGYLRVCYYTNWSQFRPEQSRLVPEKVDPLLCTHLVFAFADVQGTQIEITEFNDEQMYRRLVALKQKNPKLRVMLSLGGWLAGGSQFSALVASEESMVEFVNNVISYLRRFGFDGLDIDWEYPGDSERGSEPADRIRFTRLLQLLKAGFEEEAKQNGQKRLLLTAAVVAGIDSARQYYQISQIGRSVDFINLMAYDFHGQWDLSRGARHHSALYPEAHSAVQGWLREGFPPEKLVLGTAAFARSFILTSRPREAGVGQPAITVQALGNFSDVEGMLTFQEVCDLLQTGGWQRVWLLDQQAPAAFGNITGGRWGWAGYDDVESITAKAMYIRENGLAGAMLWAISNDDFNNRCGQGTWPLLTALREQLPDDSGNEPDFSSTVATPTPTTTTTTMGNPVTIPYNSTRWLTPSRTTSMTPRTVIRTTAARPTFHSVMPTQLSPDAGYRQCSISDSYGPSLRCTSHHGKTGFLSKFYLYCFDGFFAIECSCLPGFFYNRCLQACDAESNFLACPFRY